MKEKLFLIDGTAMVYRAHYAFIKTPLINSQGLPTSAIYGVISSFLKLIDEHSPQYLAITFDRKEKTFRHDLALEYKSNRPPIPHEIVLQLPALKDFFSLLGLPEISIPGFEADDIIGTLAKQFESIFDIIIVSNDKDFVQLVNEQIKLYDPKNNIFLSRHEVLDKYQIEPEQFIDYLALVGDASDNIPGALGIGPKTAVKLIHQYGNIETLYQVLETHPPSNEKDRLMNSKNNVFLSKILATIRTDVVLKGITRETFFFDVQRLQDTFHMLERYELKQLVKQIKSRINNSTLFTIQNADEEIAWNNQNKINSTPNTNPPSSENGKSVDFILIENLEQLKQVLAASESELIALDTETTSLNIHIAEIVGLSFCFSDHKAYYVPFQHTFSVNLEIREVLAIFKIFCKGKIIIGHNLKYDIQILDKYDFHIEKIIDYYVQVFDTMLAAYLLDPGQNNYSLTDCAQRELHYTMIPITNLIGKGKKQIPFSSVEIQQACVYAAEDAYITYSLYKIYDQRLRDFELGKLYYNIEIPLIFVLSYMEKQGVQIDLGVLANLNHKVSNQLREIVQAIYHLSGEVFNINSPQQLSKILFQKLAIPPLKKIPTGYSTDSEVLEQLAEEHEIAQLLLEYRHLSKLQSTYIEALPHLVNPCTQRVHSSFNQTITSTGRLSSSNPNLQNIPIKTDFGKQIRKAFTTNTDKYIVTADYSQIELRILAILSEDAIMCQAFREKIDIHTNTAAKIFKKPENEVDSAERRKAKMINFGIIYGMGAKSLSKELGLSLNEAKDFIDHYYHHFPTIKKYLEQQKLLAHQKGYVETIYKRRLYLSAIHSANQRNVAEAERIAVNMPIQGSAADIIKIAMINIYNRIKDRSDIKMLIQVHDELVFEVSQASLNEVAVLINSEMERALDEDFRKKVRLLVDIEYGNSWGDVN